MTGREMMAMQECQAIGVAADYEEVFWAFLTIRQNMPKSDVNRKHDT